jgi:hypothetical protein
MIDSNIKEFLVLSRDLKNLKRLDFLTEKQVKRYYQIKKRLKELNDEVE